MDHGHLLIAISLWLRYTLQSSNSHINYIFPLESFVNQNLMKRSCILDLMFWWDSWTISHLLFGILRLNFSSQSFFTDSTALAIFLIEGLAFFPLTGMFWEEAKSFSFYSFFASSFMKLHHILSLRQYFGLSFRSLALSFKFPSWLTHLQIKLHYLCFMAFYSFLHLDHLQNTHLP